MLDFKCTLVVKSYSTAAIQSTQNGSFLYFCCCEQLEYVDSFFGENLCFKNFVFTSKVQTKSVCSAHYQKRIC